MKVWQFISFPEAMYLSGVFNSERAALLWKEKMLEKFPEMSKLYRDIRLQSTHVIDPPAVDTFFDGL